ncbi:MAG TPA: hypothetical protein VM450_18575 [Thermomicrobiales bacterium]|nr:hypothetical protein [Thermomicrobiales bacterium]
MNRVHSRVIAVVVSLLFTFSMSAVAIAAQGATASPMAGAAHPSHIHKGTCAELDPNPAYPLNDVTQIGDGAVASSTTTVDVSLDDLLASPYAINVHKSAEDISTYVACGDLTGPVVDGELVIGLHQQSDSGMAGVAVLTTNDAGGTDVTVYVVDGLAS